MNFIKLKMMNKHEKIPRRKRKSFYTNSYSKIRVKEDLIADKLQVSYWGSRISFFSLTVYKGSISVENQLEPSYMI